MNLDIQWRHLRPSLILFLTTLALSCGLWLGSNTYASSKQFKLVSIENQNRELSQQIRRIATEIETVTEHRQALETLANRGLFEHEHRLQWISVFKDQVTKLKLKIASYQIEPQTENKTWSMDLNHMRLYISKMNIHLEMLHEGDLLTLLQHLERSPGYFHVNSCDIKRNNQRFVLHASAQNLQAKCQLHWFTLVPEKRGEI